MLGSSFKATDFLNESSIKDLNAFKNKTEQKLNDMINPDAANVFDTGKYLFAQ